MTISHFLRLYPRSFASFYRNVVMRMPRLDTYKARAFADRALRRYQVQDWVSVIFADLPALFPDSAFPSVVVVYDSGTAVIGIDDRYILDSRTGERELAVEVAHQVSHFWHRKEGFHGKKWEESFRRLLKRAPIAKHFYWNELNEIVGSYRGSYASCIYPEWPEG